MATRRSSTKISGEGERRGTDGVDVLTVALETEPGDVVVFTHNLKYASFGEGTRRRMFTINYCEHATEETMEVLKACTSAHSKYGMERIENVAILVDRNALVCERDYSVAPAKLSPFCGWVRRPHHRSQARI